MSFSANQWCDALLSLIFSQPGVSSKRGLFYQICETMNSPIFPSIFLEKEGDLECLENDRRLRGKVLDGSFSSAIGIEVAIISELY
ncbi:hypothetical protein CEXT_66661 [Caerostris extrusa]|uniref:Uncharacterized protein n=1 Tax=Caerostris extrusa TaxID=172846 RepID=A0AAV4MK04_CAEEX|nr:hypothetical protein CEXT_66661 [Caerostris extrusa]